MSNYLAHSVMGSIVEIKDKKVDIEKSKLMLFASGHDLLLSRKKYLEQARNFSTGDFIRTLVSEIKKQNLEDDPDVIAFLYGHILSFELDRATSPYVYYMTNDVPKKGISSFRFAAEEFLGDYILEKKLKIKRKNFYREFKGMIPLEDNPNLCNIIDDTYYKIYGIYNSLPTIKMSLVELELLKKARSSPNLIGKKLYYNLLRLDSYLDALGLEEKDLANESFNVWHDPISQQGRNDSYEKLFDIAVSKAEGKIAAVNKVLYEGKPVSSLRFAFPNESYDTGLDCDIGKPFNLSLKKSITNKRR